MESEGSYIPPEAEKFVAPIAPGQREGVEPEVLPLPHGQVREVVKEIDLPLPVQRALNARIKNVEEIGDRITPDLLMSAPGRGERYVTEAIETLSTYGVQVKAPELDASVDALGLDHVRNDRLKRLGVNTFGELVNHWQDSGWRKRLDPGDEELISRRLEHLHH